MRPLLNHFHELAVLKVRGAESLRLVLRAVEILVPWLRIQTVSYYMVSLHERNVLGHFGTNDRRAARARGCILLR